MAPVPRATPPPRPPLRCVSAAVDRLRTFGVADFTRVTHGAPAFVRRHTYSIPRITARAPLVRAHPRYPFTHAGRAWKPAPTVGIRISPTSHQPLSHGASRRDSSPFRGAEGVGGGLHPCASVYRDADSVVFLPPVRGGVLDAPWSRDCRGGLAADVQRGR